MKKMQPNISFSQLVKLNPRLAAQVAKATRHEWVPRDQMMQEWLHSEVKNINTRPNQNLEETTITTAMRCRLEVNDTMVDVIIDTGAAINVMSNRLRKILNTPINQKSNFRCIMANG